VILAMNKLDKWELFGEAHRRPLLERFEKQIPDFMSLFRTVFPVCALNGTNVQGLFRWLITAAKPGDWRFHHEMTSDQSTLQLVEEIIREKLYKRLNYETPYVVRLKNVSWKTLTDGTIQIDEHILVPDENRLKHVMGTLGQGLYALSIESKEDLEAFLKARVQINLQVRIKPRDRLEERLS